MNFPSASTNKEDDEDDDVFEKCRTREKNVAPSFCVVNVASRLRGSSASSIHPSASSIHPSASSIHPSASSIHPSASSIHPSASSIHPSACSIQQAGDRSTSTPFGTVDILKKKPSSSSSFSSSSCVVASSAASADRNRAITAQPTPAIVPVAPPAAQDTPPIARSLATTLPLPAASTPTDLGFPPRVPTEFLRSEASSTNTSPLGSMPQERNALRVASRNFPFTSAESATASSTNFDFGSADPGTPAGPGTPAASGRGVAGGTGRGLPSSVGPAISEIQLASKRHSLSLGGMKKVSIVIISALPWNIKIQWILPFFNVKAEITLFSIYIWLISIYK